MSFAKGDLLEVTTFRQNWHRAVLKQSKTFPITGDILSVPANFLKLKPQQNSGVGKARRASQAVNPRNSNRVKARTVAGAEGKVKTRAHRSQTLL